MKKFIIFFLVVFASVSVFAAACSAGSDESQWEKIYIDSATTQSSTGPTLVKYWEDKAFTEKYPSFSLAENDYQVAKSVVAATDTALIENLSCMVTMQGTDDYNPEEEHSIEVSLYKIKDISTDYAYCVYCEETDEYFAYVNTNYEFSTLGELIDGLNLEEYLSFGYAYYNYSDGEKNHYIRFDDCDDSIIWQMLWEYRPVANSYLTDSSTYSNTYFSFSVNIPCLGYENISLGFNSKGYIQTNIFGTGKTFYIGTQAITEFTDNFIKTIKGYELVYPD